MALRFETMWFEAGDFTVGRHVQRSPTVDVCGFAEHTSLIKIPLLGTMSEMTNGFLSSADWHVVSESGSRAVDSNADITTSEALQ